MSAFKDQVDSDISLVFLNCEEFAETHNLNGLECECIIQSPTTHEKFITGADYDGYEGIYGNTLIIHVKQSEIAELPEERKPIEGQIFRVDNVIYKVIDCVEEMGMITITLGGSMGG